MKMKTERTETLKSGKGKDIRQTNHKFATQTRLFIFIVFLVSVPCFLLWKFSDFHRFSCVRGQRQEVLRARDDLGLWVQGDWSHLSARTKTSLCLVAKDQEKTLEHSELSSYFPMLLHFIDLAYKPQSWNRFIDCSPHSISNKAIEALAVCHADIMKAEKMTCVKSEATTFKCGIKSFFLIFSLFRPFSSLQVFARKYYRRQTLKRHHT